MAGGQPVDIMGYRFRARPLSRWRRFTLDFIPYWQGSKPRFVLTVTRKESTAETQPLLWYVRFATGDKTWGQLAVPPLMTGETAKFIIGDKFLGFTGDTLITLPKDLVRSDPNHYETVYAFHTTPKTWLVLAASAGFLAGLFGALAHWLFGL